MSMSKRVLLWVSLAAVTLALSACANQPKRWDKADTDKETRWSDISECGKHARQRMNTRDLEREERFHGRAIALEQGYRNHDVAAMRRMQEAEYLRARRRVFEDCMALKGYRPSRAKAAKGDQS